MKEEIKVLIDHISDERILKIIYVYLNKILDYFESTKSTNS